MIKKENLRIRDPFILVDGENYYMYGTTELESDSGLENKFSVYVSKDLENFDGPYVVFDGKESDFWADRNYWAAEVWKYNGRFYLFGSFKSEEDCRATQILVSDSPFGPFVVLSNKARTPKEWECLDGTLWVENGIPYMVFCHEWLQCEDGEICAIELTPDLRETVGKAFVLFKASDNPYVESFKGPAGENCRITDGPFLYRENGKLNMIWSSVSNGKYAVLEASADSLRSEWKHYKSRFSFDGGHAMIFTDLDGKRYFSLHQPNQCPEERVVFIPFEKE